MPRRVSKQPAAEPPWGRMADGGESGSALVIVLTITFLFSALAIGMTTAVGLEATGASRFRDGTEALYVAEAGLALAIADLREHADWTPVLQGVVRSRASIGPFSGSATVAAGGRVLLCCGGTSVAGRLARESASAGVPARRSLPWQPFLWSPWDAIVPQPAPGRLFLVVFLANDEDEDDDRIDRNGVVMVRAEAIRPDGLRRVVEGLLAREPADPDRGIPARVRILHWREVR